MSRIRASGASTIPAKVRAAFALISAATLIGCGSDDGPLDQSLDAGVDLRDPSVQADAVSADDTFAPPSTRPECGEFVLRTQSDVQALAALECERVERLWFLRDYGRRDNQLGSLSSLRSIRAVDGVLGLEGLSDAQVAEVAGIGIEAVDELHILFTWDLERIDLGSLRVNNEVYLRSNPVLHTLGDTGRNIDFRGDRILLMNNLALPRCEVQQFIDALTSGDASTDVEVVAYGNTVRDRESCLAVDGNCDGSIDSAPEPCPDEQVCLWEGWGPAFPVSGDWYCASP